MWRSEKRDVCRVVRRDRATPEANSGSDNKHIDRQLAPSLSDSEKMTSDACDPSPRGDDLRESPSEEGVDCFIGPSSSMEFDEHG